MSSNKLSTNEKDTDKNPAAMTSPENESTFRGFFESSHDAMVLISGNVIIDCNAGALEMMACDSRQWLLHKHISEISPVRQPDGSLSTEKASSIFSRALHSGNAMFEWLHKKQNGDLLYVEISLTLIPSRGETVFLAIWRDVSDRKKTEEALRESEETARMLINATDEAVLLVDKKGGIISANARFVMNHGSDIRSLINKNIHDLFSEEMAKKIRRMINEVLRERRTIRHEEEENASWFEMKLYPISEEMDNIAKAAIFIKDITSERRYEEALRESEKKYRQIVDTANEGILVANEDFRITLVNRQIIKMTGYSEEEMIGKSLSEFIHKADREEYDTRIHRRIQGKSQQYELRLRKNDGSLLWVIVSASPVFDTKNRFRGSITLFTDITERKKIEEDIRESEERYRTAIEHSNDGVAILEGDSFIYVNQKFVDMFGYDSTNEIMELKQSMTVHPDEAQFVSEINRGRQMGKDVPQRYEFRGLRKDGSSIHLEVSATKTQYRGNTVTLAYLRDVTSRRLMENELLNSKKLESIGILAGGIAHDFNNLLMSILGYISLAKMYLQPDDTKASEKLSEAENTIDKAKDLTVQLLTFSRGGSPVKKAIRLEHFIRDSVKIPLSGSHVRCRYSFHEHLWPVNADESQLRQVIHHMALNAREAMADSGTITFSARNTTVEKEHESFLQAGDYVELSISDNGKGIEKGYLSQVFDPYFTTKDFGPQKGMGLGLAVCYSIIKKHGGHIEVESVVKEGTTFKVYLPAGKHTAVSTREEHLHPGQKKLRILIADDEEAVLKTTGLILDRLGHNVSTVLDSKEAINLYRQSMESKDPFDVVILDLTSPDGLGGVRILEQLLRIDPSVYALLSSGYPNDPHIINYGQYGFKGVLLKPYRIEELNEILKKVKKSGHRS
ncbi:MAG TPA: PAS domain S-box protein [Syntrophorhabdaceae bacterium]|nr:PAS domain S-box protein [Syntrophorhabdaceae bacterium]